MPVPDYNDPKTRECAAAAIKGKLADVLAILECSAVGLAAWDMLNLKLHEARSLSDAVYDAMYDADFRARWIDKDEVGANAPCELDLDTFIYRHFGMKKEA